MKCQNCGEKVARFPLKDSDGNIIWKNLFKMDLMSILWIIVIIFLVISYKADTETCREIVTNPLKYCRESNACKIIEERNGNQYRTINIEDIPEIKLNG